MKTKRHSKKNNAIRNNSTYTPGYNVFGNKAEIHLVVLKRDTAFQQIMDCICQLDGSEKEFTLDMRCFKGHEEELEQIWAKVESFMALKARMSHKPFFDCSDWMEDVA